jgi:hypothetical protein
MSDIYLSLTETPSVVTLSQPVVASVMVNTVTVANVVSVNVVTMPAINVTAAGGLTNAELRASAVSVAVTTMPALSISSVSISNFPASQIISGTVTANLSNVVTNNTYWGGNAIMITGEAGKGLLLGGIDAGNNPAGIYEGGGVPVIPRESCPSFPISGTVTANLTVEALVNTQAGIASDAGGAEPSHGVQIGYFDASAQEFTLVDTSNPLPISGTVTANVLGNKPFDNSTYDSGNVVPVQIIRSLDGLVLGDENPLSISGTVTVGAMPSGSLTTRFGSVTTANTAQLTSAVTNTSRKYLLVQNIATSTVTIGIGFAPTTTQGIQLTAGAGLTFDAFCPTGGVWWLSSTTGSNFSILEG